MQAIYVDHEDRKEKGIANSDSVEQASHAISPGYSHSNDS